jgi:hypothetical protein
MTSSGLQKKEYTTLSVYKGSSEREILSISEKPLTGYAKIKQLLSSHCLIPFSGSERAGRMDF